ncbi:hypothetical protein [Candidatus Uabimicrobium sp. HlEnr_7]|uniref:hypothetical protein n=1 Tax=Candidatus Uabimicrobium helgolandensis TaxID=3095367 RepID=UPI003558CE58
MFIVKVSKKHITNPFNKGTILSLPLIRIEKNLLHKIVDFRWKNNRLIYEMNHWSVLSANTNKNSLNEKKIKGKCLRIVLGERIYPFDGGEHYVPFHNISVYNNFGHFIAATSWKRSRKLVEIKKATIRSHRPFSIQLTYNPDLLEHNPLRWSGKNLQLNYCQICNSKQNLTRHHIWPSWHPRSTLSETKNCTYNTAILCQKCHSQAETYYLETLALELTNFKAQDLTKISESYQELAISQNIDFTKIYTKFLKVSNIGNFL